MEFVDIVNNDGRVISSCSKDEAHQTGALHRCVIAELIDSEGNWTLVRQAADRQDAGQYVNPAGGHVSAGETTDQALEREVNEELGLKSINYKFKDKAIFNRDILGRKENHYFYVYEVYSDKTPILNEESVDYRKFTVTELKKELKDNPESFGAGFHFVVKNFYPELL